MKATQTYHHIVGPVDNQASYIWQEEATLPFDELIVSWNGKRPVNAMWKVFVSIKTDTWSPFFLYAGWGAHEQYGGDAISPHLRIHQDILEVLQGQLAHGFKVRIDCNIAGELIGLYQLFACVSRAKELYLDLGAQMEMDKVDLAVPLLSQMSLIHDRKHHLCSPSSTAAVVSYLLGKPLLDPLEFALKVRDEAFDIFGNWVLNVAQASSLLGESWKCWVGRLRSFDDICKSLCLGNPVIVSIKGSLPGGALAYAQGHLVVVKGYVPLTKQILCMDPAFFPSEATAVAYPVQEFLTAWAKRGYVAYFFEKAEKN